GGGASARGGRARGPRLEPDRGDDTPGGGIRRGLDGPGGLLERGASRDRRSGGESRPLAPGRARSSRRALVRTRRALSPAPKRFAPRAGVPAPGPPPTPRPPPPRAARPA